MATTLEATFDGKVFVPDQPVDLLVGQKVSVLVADQAARTPSRLKPSLGKFLEQIPDELISPTDGAAQHDHYLYGTPKRENP